MSVELDKETVSYLQRLEKRGGYEGEQARNVLVAAGIVPELIKGSDDEERDDKGRWTSGGSGGSETSTREAIARTLTQSQRAHQSQVSGNSITDMIHAGHSDALKQAIDMVTNGASRNDLQHQQDAHTAAIGDAIFGGGGPNGTGVDSKEIAYHNGAAEGFKEADAALGAAGLS